MRRPVAVMMMVSVFAVGGPASAQQDRTNAALRYWQAFAFMEDPPADKDTATLLENVAGGKATWDEARLRPILDANREALEIMRRASTLTECDWGVEYSLGPEAPVAYPSKAVVLGRLNAIDGIRFAQREQYAQAVAAWMAGVRFSRHVASGGTLLATLVGRSILLANLGELPRLLEGVRAAAAIPPQQPSSGSPAVSGDLRVAFFAPTQNRAGAIRQVFGLTAALESQRARALIESFPESGFDWSAAVDRELTGLRVWVERAAQARSPRSEYERVFGTAPSADFTFPAPAEITAFVSVKDRAVAALKLSPEAARGPLQQSDAERQKLHPLFRDAFFSLSRINEARLEIKTARERLLKLLSPERAPRF